MLRREVPLREAGDVNARVWNRVVEIGEFCALINRILNDLPGAPFRTVSVPIGVLRAGLGLVEGFRGDILCWLRLNAAGRIMRCHLRDPSWFLWPPLDAAIEGNIIADFPFCNKSFSGSYCGHDL